MLVLAALERTLMSRLALLYLFLIPPQIWAQSSSDWKPASGPLFTKWGKEVDPVKVLPEHPRPQMMRQDWLNLNGVWEYYIGQKGLAESHLVTFKKILVP